MCCLIIADIDFYLIQVVPTVSLHCLVNIFPFGNK